jgi:hypothetical protein
VKVLEEQVLQDELEDEDESSHLEIVTTTVETVCLYEEFPHLEAEAELPVL